MLYDLINGYDSLYSNIENYYQHLINELNALLKDYIIKDYKDIEKLLSDEFIKQLILKVK